MSDALPSTTTAITVIVLKEANAHLWLCLTLKRAQSKIDSNISE